MATRLTLKALSHKEDRLSPGHRLCAGCAEPIIARQILLAIDEPVVIANATGCLEVSTTIYPYSAWRVPWMHNAFENAAATISGIETAYKSLVKQGKIEDQDIKFLAFAGDGGTYDIGIQALSGAVERGHAFLYVCFDNGAYMNTGIQRSSATPLRSSHHHLTGGEGDPGQDAVPKTPDRDHGRPRHALRGSGLALEVAGPDGEGPQGGRRPRPSLPQRARPLPTRLALPHRADHRGQPAGHGHLLVAVV